MLNKMKDLLEMQKSAKQMQKQLQKISITVERLDGKIKMTFNGEKNVKDIQINKALLREENKSLLEQNIRQCINDASGKIQKELLAEMKGNFGGFNFPS